MKIFFLILSLLVLSSRLHNVQGIPGSGAHGVRLRKSSVTEVHAQKFQGKSIDVVQRVEDGVINIAAAVREEAHSPSAGMNRKLMTKTTPASITISTSSKKLEGKTISSREASGNEHFRVNTSPISEEVLDIAEMDYSPAKKRSPIHN